MRKTYLGERLTAQRTISQGSDSPADGRALLIPEMRIEDAGAEPLRVFANIPSYGEEYVPIREVHVFAFADGTPEPGDPEEWIASPPAGMIHAHADVTGLKGVDLPIDLAGVGEGSMILQAVLVADDSPAQAAA